MREIGLIFQGWGVRAILEGRKTQTRRTGGLDVVNGYPDIFALEDFDPVLGEARFHGPIGNLVVGRARLQVGDTMYVKETWADMICVASTQRGKGTGESEPIYRSSADPVELEILRGHWKSSMFMPKKYARIRRTITRVRCQRLQEISDKDVFAEGIRGLHEIDAGKYPWSLQGAYGQEWDKINGPGSWEKNLWVWVYEW